MMATHQAGASLVRDQIQALELAEGFFQSQVLFSINELGIFDLLADRPMTLDEIVAATGVDRGGLERLANAGAALGLLTGSDGMYRNGAIPDRVLVQGRPGYLGNWMRLLARWMRTWTNLTEGVRTGKPVQDSSLHLGDDPEFTRDFVLGMDDYAKLRGSEIVRYLEFEDGLHVLDLGGGPGRYAILLAQHWPGLHVTIFDLPDVVKIAAENCRAAGLDGRVRTEAGIYLEDDIPGSYDVVFLSDVLHQEDPRTCRLILRKAYRALKPGGRIVIQGMFLNDDRMSPRWPVLHSVLLMLLYEGGRAYTVGETVEFLEAAGFQNCQHKRMSLLNVNSLIFAGKDA
jgi:2-polyprenyl-3-methyl-5-hydroxy-6-metoxy-1,4-benzoquinol methylase